MIDFEKWKRDGFCVLPAFYSHADIDVVRDEQQRAWNEGKPRIVVDDLMTGRRLRMQDVSENDKVDHRFKVNDLYLESSTIRALALNDRLTPVLAQLLGHIPVVCNSLSFEQGSGQPDHVDALYMTPRSRGHLIAIWVALEDCHADAGPLRYYPGSHKIEPYVFSSGSNHFIQEEMKNWQTYMEGEVQRMGLKPTCFAARKGDVFIWSAYLLHGGEPIRNHQLTRRSLVFHYYSEPDARMLAGNDLVPEGGGYWLYRAHQPVDGRPGEFPLRKH